MVANSQILVSYLFRSESFLTSVARRLAASRFGIFRLRFAAEPGDHADQEVSIAAAG
jgi:hypothetical protein